MRRSMVNVIVLALVCALSLTGCGVRKAASVQDAINKSKTIKTVEKQKEYLIIQAKAFFTDKDFKTSIDISQYILRKVYPEAKEPKALIRKAEDAMVVQKQIEDRATEEVSSAAGK